ncbi:hypothetical protein DFS34DRAFT_661683 [Phlyctochytrium arcticum]|nr:hypothetical protein DFS34DRAFT_661683 [Phlyctochytrium arcticum]
MVVPVTTGLADGHGAEEDQYAEDGDGDGDESVAGDGEDRDERDDAGNDGGRDEEEDFGRGEDDGVDRGDGEDSDAAIEEGDSGIVGGAVAVPGKKQSRTPLPKGMIEAIVTDARGRQYLTHVPDLDVDPKPVEKKRSQHPTIQIVERDTPLPIRLHNGGHYASRERSIERGRRRVSPVPERAEPKETPRKPKDRRSGLAAVGRTAIVTERAPSIGRGKAKLVESAAQWELAALREENEKLRKRNSYLETTLGDLKKTMADMKKSMAVELNGMRKSMAAEMDASMDAKMAAMFEKRIGRRPSSQVSSVSSVPVENQGKQKSRTGGTQASAKPQQIPSTPSPATRGAPQHLTRVPTQPPPVPAPPTKQQKLPRPRTLS